MKRMRGLLYITAKPTGALECSYYFVLLEFGFEILQLVNHLFLLKTLAFDDQAVLFWANVWNREMVPSIKELIGSQVALCQTFYAWFTIEWLRCSRK